MMQKSVPLIIPLRIILNMVDLEVEKKKKKKQGVKSRLSSEAAIWEAAIQPCY